MAVVYWSAAAFAFALVGYAAWRAERKERLFWALLWVGLLADFLGYLLWKTVGELKLPTLGVALQDVTYFISYYLLFVALLYVVAVTMRGMTPLCMLDVLGVMLCAGLLAWYFILSPVGASTHPEGLREIVVNLYGPMADAGFLFLCLLLLSSEGRPPFAGWLWGGFVVFLAGDLFYAEAHSFGAQGPGKWPEMFWTLGILMFGLAACWSKPGSLSFSREIRSQKILSFWLGPLLPAIQYAFLLFWTTLHPPVPLYVVWTGVLLMIYFALRMPMLAYLGHGLRLEVERFARREEQGRISRELHDTVKQNVVGTSMILKACRGAHKGGDSAAVGDLLEQALETCGEAGYQLSKPIDEFAMFSGSGASTPTIYFTNRTRKFGEYFGLDSHADLQAPLEELCPVEVSVAQRVVIEAFWNVAKHSCAKNLWLESYREDADFVVLVRDDGRGFSIGVETEGMGRGFMCSRAAEVGAELRFMSEPGEGTTVELRFPRKKG